MTVALAVVLILHGLVHLLGFAKAFRLAELSALTQPIPPSVGLFWLVAALLFEAAAASLLLWPRAWWVIATVAILVSTAVIVPSWSDARVGAAVNLVLLVAVVFGALAYGPRSLRAAYDDDVARGLTHSDKTDTVTDADLAALPPLVGRYLRVAGVVGQPRVRNFRVRMRGRIRSGPHAAWMPMEAEQFSFVDTATRLFYLTARMFGVPVQGYHRYADGAAAMTIKAAALLPVMEVAGPEMHQSETVTMFNDLCLLAPGALIDPSIQWEPVDARRVRGRYTNGPHAISAELTFNAAGELIDFVSDDRYQASPDGRTLRKVRWSTPIARYRSFGSVRLGGGGEGRWHEAGGAWTYVELTLLDVTYNVE